MSVWGWLDRASRVMKGADDPLAPFPNLKRLFEAIDARPAAARARALGKGHPFKQVNADQARRATFPSNFPACGVSESPEQPSLPTASTISPPQSEPVKRPAAATFPTSTHRSPTPPPRTTHP